jgi:hypothetical protein
MTSVASITPLVGMQATGNFDLNSTTQNHPLGTVVDVVDGYFGGQRLKYVSFPASTALVVGTPVVWSSAFSATAVPNTANLGQSVGFTKVAVASNTAVQYGWIIISGKCPIASGASVAADAQIGITAAGRLGAVANGKEILGAKVQVAATTTVVKTASLAKGSYIIKVSDSGGWFVGMPLTGTGVGASAKITVIDPNNKTVTVDVVSTATSSASVTGTYNDSTIYWNVVDVNAPFAQGQTT